MSRENAILEELRHSRRNLTTVSLLRHFSSSEGDDVWGALENLVDEGYVRYSGHGPNYILVLTRKGTRKAYR